MFDDLKEETKKNDLTTKINPNVKTEKKGKPQVPEEEVEDIFSATDSADKPLVFQVKDKLSTSSLNDAGMTKTNNTQKILILLGIFCIFILLCVTGYLSYVSFLGGKDKSDNGLTSVEDVNNNFNNNQDKQTIPKKQEVESKVKVDESKVKKEESADILEDETQKNEKKNNDDNMANKDSDGDGLSDIEESILGTNINNKDTDTDGISDDQEIKIYRTDPLSPDSDNDGYSDGAEIKSGYNPNGSGKL